MNKEELITEITIVIVLYREEFELISKTLSSLESFKIIIIDNDNNSNLKTKIESNFSIEHYILNKKNIGFSAGYNQGIKLSKTSYTLIINPDYFILEKDILLLKKKLIENKNCYIVSATAYDENDNLTYTGGLLPENGEKNETLNITGDTCVESILGACMFFETKNILDNDLLFDENFFLYYSDDDLCKRIKKKNKSIVQVYDAKSKHQHGTIKIKNRYIGKFVREFNLNHDRYYYYYKDNKHTVLLNDFKNKIPSLIIKFIVKILSFKLLDCVSIFSRLYAYFKFKNKFK
tara:strand:- start:245 stop:1117 length:873 start_codon:yes stop_codon:yes gene_type:complete